MFSCLSTIPFELEFKIQVRFIPWLSVGTRYNTIWVEICSTLYLVQALQCCSSAAVDTNVGRLHSSGQSLRTAPGAATCSGVMQWDPGKFKSSSFSFNFIVSFQDFEILISCSDCSLQKMGSFRLVSLRGTVGCLMWGQCNTDTDRQLYSGHTSCSHRTMSRWLTMVRLNLGINGPISCYQMVTS